MIAMQNSNVNIPISVYHYFYLSGFVVIYEILKMRRPRLFYANFKI